MVTKPGRELVLKLLTGQGRVAKKSGMKWTCKHLFNFVQSRTTNKEKMEELIVKKSALGKYFN